MLPNFSVERPPFADRLPNYLLAAPQAEPGHDDRDDNVWEAGAGAENPQCREKDCEVSDGIIT